jgi:hypothetical protein
VYFKSFPSDSEEYSQQELNPPGKAAVEHVILLLQE